MKSTTLLFGDRVRPILAAFSVVFLLCITYAGILNNQGPAYFTFSVGGSALFFAWLFITWKPDDAEDCHAKFKVRVSAIPPGVRDLTYALPLIRQTET